MNQITRYALEILAANLNRVNVEGFYKIKDKLKTPELEAQWTRKLARAIERELNPRPGGKYAYMVVLALVDQDDGASYVRTYRIWSKWVKVDVENFDDFILDVARDADLDPQYFQITNIIPLPIIHSFLEI